MSSKPRICHLITALGHGGAEHLLVDLVRTVDDAEFTIGYFGSEDDLVADMRDEDATVKSFDEAFRFDIRAFARCAKYLRQNSFDVVHTHLPYAKTIGRVAASMVGTDVLISTQHNVPSNHHPVTRTADRITRPLDDVSVAVSKGVERACTGDCHQPNEFGDEWCTIYNGINAEQFSNTVDSTNVNQYRYKSDTDDESLIFLSVGRYVPVKAHQDLIKAFAIADLTESDLILVGHGPLEEQLRQAANGYNISDRVHITGQVPNVEPYYALADVFVSSSRGEGLPITTLEAMSASLPVIGMRIPGVDEVVVDGETGYLCPPGNMNTFAERMSRMKDQSHRQELGSAGFVRVQEIFSINKTIESYMRLYDTIQTDRIQK